MKEVLSIILSRISLPSVGVRCAKELPEVRIEVVCRLFVEPCIKVLK